jgi:TRAP-type mannitol/chloroaromatic compound transport system permease small subunit
MQKLLLAVDSLSTWFGKACAWTVIGLTLLITWEVFSRYVLNNPHAWVLDAQIMLYGVLFMSAGAYTLAKSGHVRGDVLYGFFSPRTQAGWDLALYILFFLPGIVALTRCRSTRSNSWCPLPAPSCCCKASLKSSAASCACKPANGPSAHKTLKRSMSKNSKKWCT